MKKLFIFDTKGYMETKWNVKKVNITKIDRKLVLEVIYTMKEKEIISLRNIETVFLTDMETMEELFRYEKYSK